MLDFSVWSVLTLAHLLLFTVLAVWAARASDAQSELVEKLTSRRN